MATKVLKQGVNTRKIVSISSKRQITIPQKFYELLGFETEAEVIVENNSLVIRPVHIHAGGDFAECILKELLEEGYSGDSLLKEFKARQARIKPAVYSMLEEAHMVAEGKAEYGTLNDAFGEDMNE